jgi:membrane associated rhomboid family serine protease
VDGRVSAYYDKVTNKITNILNQRPSRKMHELNSRVVLQLQPFSRRMDSISRSISKNMRSPELKTIASTIRYRGVAGLIGVNMAVYMLLNSHMMKVRSPHDGLSRADRHWVTSKFNLSNWRPWCVPLSIFNHGDSLFQLGMNCFALALVGPAVEVAFGAGALVGGFMFCGTLGAIAEMVLGNHWCRGSSGGVAGLFATGALMAPSQLLSVWGMFDVRAMPLALSVFGVESLFGLFGGNTSSMAHMAHAGGMAAALPFLYYMKWFR